VPMVRVAVLLPVGFLRLLTHIRHYMKKNFDLRLVR
jgi:hypothetical protein